MPKKPKKISGGGAQNVENKPKNGLVNGDSTQEKVEKDKVLKETLPSSDTDTEKKFEEARVLVPRAMRSPLPQRVILSELKDFITKVEIDAKQDEHGNYIIVPNGEYAIKLKFAENESSQFNDTATLTYDIPTAFTVANVSNTEFDIDIVDSQGQARVSKNVFRVENGKLYVEFNKSDPNFTRLQAMANVTFEVEFKGKFTQEITEVEFNGTIKKTFKFENISDLEIIKKASYVKEGNKVDYVLEVKSKGINNKVVIEDTIVGTALTLNNDVKVKSSIKGDLQVTPKYDGNKFTISDINMVNDETLTVTYSAKVDYDKLTGRGKPEETKNIANVKSEETPEPKIVEKTVEIDFFRLTKTPGNHTLVPGSSTEYTHTWTLEINKDKLFTVGGKILYDRVSPKDRVKFIGEGIKITVNKEDGSQEVRNIKWDQLELQKQTNGNITGWDYKTPESDGKAHYIVEMQVQIDTSNALGDIHAPNWAKIGNQEVYQDKEIKINIGEEFKPKKEAIKVNSLEILWKITIPIPADGYGGKSVKVVDDLPKTIYEGRTYFDTVTEDQIEIKGLLQGETFKIDNRIDGDYRGPIIEFYKSATQTPENAGLLATSDGKARTIEVFIRSKVNQDWLQKAHEAGYATSGAISPIHANNFSVRIGGDQLGGRAEAIPMKQTITKVYLGYDKVNEGGLDYPVFKYEVEITNPKEGEIVTDSFDKNYLKFKQGSLTVKGRNQSGDAYNESGSVTGVEDGDGLKITLSNLPKDTSGKLYKTYVIGYKLIVKDEETLKKLNKEAFQNEGVELKNIARWNGLESKEVKAKYTNNSVIDKLLIDAPTSQNSYVGKFKLILNEKATDIFPEGNEYTVKDTLSKNLRFLPNSIKVVEGDYTLDYGFDAETNTLTFNKVPDNKKIVIEYEARVLGKGETTFVNTVVLGQYEKKVEETTTIVSTGSGTASNPSIKIVKRDKDAYASLLSGAVFKLSYLDKHGAEVEVKDKSNQVVKFTTDDKGEALIVGNMEQLGWVLWTNREYILTEEKAPKGYNLTNTKVKFKLSENPEDQTQFNIVGESIDVSNERPKTEVEAKKTWINTSSNYPEVWFKLYRSVAGGALEEVSEAPVKKLEPGTTSVKWTDLYAKDLDEKPYTFVVKEVDKDGKPFVPKDFEKVEEGLTVKNYYNPKIEIEVVKTWKDDSGNLDRPESIEIILERDGVEFKRLTLSKGTDVNIWKGKFTDLPKYKPMSSQEYVYAIKEVLPKGYEKVVENFSITNTRILTNISITKVWQSVEGEKLPASITYRLFRDGVEINNITVNNPNWNYTFDKDKQGNKLPKTNPKTGKDYVYTIKEDAVPGYISKVDGLLVTNSQEKVEKEVSKKWINSTDAPNPIKITALLLRDGKEYKKAVLSQDNGWKYKFTDLPKTDETGRDYVYTVDEEAVPGYTKSIDQATGLITNSREKVEKEVSKVWVNKTDDENPTQITAILLRNGVEYKREVLSQANDWKHKFTDLPKTDETGRDYEYTVDEEAVPGYTKTIDQVTGQITNTKETIDIEVTKTWKDESGNLDRPESIEFILNRDGKEYKRIVLSKGLEENVWKKVFEGLPKTDNTGREYVYTIDEVLPKGYEKVIENFSITNTRVLITIPVEKVWDSVQGEKLPASITYRLFRDGIEINSVTVNNPDWNYTFDKDKEGNKLPKTNPKTGEDYVYTIKEDAVAGYVTEIEGFVVKNKQERVEKEVSKVWINSEGTSNPTRIRAILLRNGKEYSRVELSQANNWKYVFKDLPKTDENGKDYEYTIDEVDVEGYEKKVDQKTGVITNTKIPKPKTPPKTGDIFGGKVYIYMALIMAAFVALIKLSKNKNRAK